MPYIHVTLEIPPWVEAGLRDGSLIRDAAGIIRKADTKEIICHLREIDLSPFWQNLCMSPVQWLTAGLQIATIGYLKLRLDRVERSLESLYAMSEHILSELRSIEDHLWLTAVQGVARGVELLARERARGDGHWLHDAERYFITGAADIWLHIHNRSGEGLIEHAPYVQKLLSYAAMAAAGEFICMGQRRADEREMLAVLGQHRDHWNEFRRSLASVLPPTHRFPTLKMLQASGNPWHMRNTWDDEAHAIIQQLENEQVFQQALTHVDQDSIPPSHSPGTDDQTLVICLLLPQGMPLQPKCMNEGPKTLHSPRVPQRRRVSQRSWWIERARRLSEGLGHIF